MKNKNFNSVKIIFVAVVFVVALILFLKVITPKKTTQTANGGSDLLDLEQRVSELERGYSEK